MNTESNTTANKRYRLNYQAPAYSIEKIELFFDLDCENTKVKSRWNYKKIKSEDLVLHGVDLKLCSLRLNEKEISKDFYILGPETLTLKISLHRDKLKLSLKLIQQKMNLSKVCIFPKGPCAPNANQKAFVKLPIFLIDLMS